MRKPIVVIYKDSEDAAETFREVVYADCFYTAIQDILKFNPNAFIVGEG